MNDDSNSNFKNWKCRVDEFRGYMKGKIESLEATIKNHCDDSAERRKEMNDRLGLMIANMTKMRTSVIEIQKFMAGKAAVSKIKTGIYGFFGGLIPVILAFILYKLFS